jgi:hypothetical protein
LGAKDREGKTLDLRTGRGDWVTSRRSCPGYGPLCAGDQRQKLFDNLVAFADFVRVKDPWS